MATHTRGEEADPNVRPHLSPSALDTFCKCPEQYRRRYIMKEKLPPGIAAHRGRGIHKGVQVNFAQKVETRKDLPASQIVEACVSEFEAGIQKEGYLLSGDEAARGATVVIGEEKDSVATLAEAFATVQAPDYQPTLVEEEIRIELPDSTHDLLGYLDLLTDDDIIADFKSAKKRKSQADADNSVQLTFYAAGAYIKTGRKPTVRLDVILDQRKGVQRQILDSTRDLPDFRALANRTSAVLVSIKAGAFPPAMPGSWWCSAKWCGYWSTCPYVNSERKLLQIEE